MHNHQSEIADALSADGYIVKADVSSVLDKVDQVLGTSIELKVYPKKQEGVVVDLIN